MGINRIVPLLAALALLGAGARQGASPMLTSAEVRNDPEVSPMRSALRTTGVLITPEMADSFADSLGVNTRFGQGIYERQRATVAADLVELGFRHIRDGEIDYKPETRSFLAGLCTTNGIHSSLGLGDMDSDAAILQYVKDVPCIDMVEGPNELNGQPNWSARLATFIPHAYNLIRSSPSFSGIPFVGPSITRLEDAQTLGQAADLSQYVDYGNKHSYPGQRNIGGGNGTGDQGFGPKHAACPKYAYGSYFFAVCAAQRFTKGRPIWTTETGYSSTPSGLPDPPKHPPWGSIPYDVAAKYLPRLMAYEFSNGISRTYIMALLDGSSGCNGPFNALGLIEQDCPHTSLASSLHKKPPFYALKNLMATVSDPGPAFVTKPISLKLDGADGKVQTLLLQKRNGQYVLLYWVEASDWDVALGSYVTVAPEPLTITIGGGVKEDDPQTFGIDKTGNLTPHKRVDGLRGSLRLTATDEMQFLTFRSP